jgi:Cu+-exporting ATPase
MGSGTDIAIESGDIVLAGGEVENILKAFLLCRSTFKKIRQNIFWAYAYNIVAIPLAFLGMLHPVVAEIAMAASSISVALNSGRLAQNSRFK